MAAPVAPHRLLVRDALIVTIGGGADGKRGKAMGDVEAKENHSMLVDADGVICALGPTAEVDAVVADLRAKGGDVAEVVEGKGKTLLPGFVDAHTHAVFAGDRSGEMRMKLAGATYMDVHKAGGGIGFTVRHTREATEDDLQDLLVKRLHRMAAGGTTTVEVKSGYGLDVDTEMKMLRVIHKADKIVPIDLQATFCGAHSIPPGSNADEATEDVIKKQLPALKELRDAGEIDPKNIDVFCEKGFFEVDHTRRILQAGKELGLVGNFHGDELNPMGSGELGEEVGARAISHLEHLSEAGIAAMARANIFGVLLPTTAYVLRLVPPPARAMIDAGVPVALGSDFNPNAHCLTMPFVMNLACVLMRMTMEEALVAATINSAAALHVADKVGSLAVGKLGDAVLIDSPKWEHIIYEMGDGVPILAVYKGGRACGAPPAGK